MHYIIVNNKLNF